MKTLGIILAGGKGTRLVPLVMERCKPAVPFAGKYRILDFVLSNCINSDIRQINVMVQYRSDSLQKHIRDGWSILSTALGEYIDVYPPQQRIGERWYSGTADAIYQNLYSIERVNPEYILILGGDHVYRMDYREMIEAHIKSKADCTIGCIPVHVDEGRGQFGIMEIEDNKRIKGFEEKPAEPKSIPGKNNMCLASMGIYVFSKDVLVEQLESDAQKESSHDFGKDIIPGMIESHNVFAYLFEDKNGNPAYWKDVGTLNAYFDTHMDLLKPEPEFDLYDPKWKYRTFQDNSAPAKVISQGKQTGKVVNSILCNGDEIAGTVKNSILSYNVVVESGAHVENSIIFSDVTIKSGAQIRNTIIDKLVTIPENTKVGYDIEKDKIHFKVTDSNIVAIPRKFDFSKIQK